MLHQILGFFSNLGILSAFPPCHIKRITSIDWGKVLNEKTRGSQHLARQIHGNRFINFAFNSPSSVLNKKWIAVCGGPLCGSLNALLHITAILQHIEKEMCFLYKFFLYKSFQRK